MSSQTANNWASHFGLAVAPLFSSSEIEAPASHSVLLDGGFGSFALSVGEAADEHRDQFKSWAWSSNLAHHVAVNDTHVRVSRWDKADAEVLTRASVEKRLGAFYKYLIADRVRSNQRVTDHLLDLFRSMRSLIADAGRDDNSSILAFLTFIERVSLPDGQALPLDMQGGSFPEGYELLQSLSSSSLANLWERATQSEVFSSYLELLPRLAIRHAGSEIFQEAHYEFLRAPTPDLFGYVGPVQTGTTTRGGAHFTPPALARSLCEQTIPQISNISTLRELTILDPACGSGAFLHESTRTLQRMGFNGRLHLIGRDISQPAISMAEFTLRYAMRDWTPEGGVEVDVRVGDSLSEPLPASDVVLMNPPFVSWAALNQKQRDQMREVLDGTLSGRADLSMAFVTKGLSSLRAGGVLGALTPSSLLTLQSAEDWRTSLLEHGTLKFIASLGDHGLFSHALVSVAALVIGKGVRDDQHKPVKALIASNRKEATGEALRALRRDDRSSKAASASSSWRLFNLKQETFSERATWRLMRPEMERLVHEVFSGGARPIGDLFDVKQGVLTGNNKAFIIDHAYFESLPKKEKRFFRPAIVNDSLSSGEITSQHWVFYPYGPLSEETQTEDDLAKAVRNYYNSVLKPNKMSLGKRPSITRSKNSKWWDLSEKRAWALNGGPRIVSKYFGGMGGFAVDMKAEYLVVQGYAWLPKWISTENVNQGVQFEGLDEITLEIILHAYSALMNSTGFSAIIEVFSPHVAGGQFNLSPRYVNSIPIPDFPSILTDMQGGNIVERLAKFGREPELNSALWRTKVDSLVEELYGTQLVFEES
tara:strand:+ start:1517 stop:3979 length:2463 start_codon:yes stop_codon:yes gene_type:complete